MKTELGHFTLVQVLYVLSVLRVGYITYHTSSGSLAQPGGARAALYYAIVSGHWDLRAWSDHDDVVWRNQHNPQEPGGDRTHQAVAPKKQEPTPTQTAREETIYYYL